MRQLTGITVLVILLCTSMVAQAGQITCTFSGASSGSVGGMPFTNKLFTITAIGDTNDRQQVYPKVFQIINQSTSIVIKDVGTYSFVTGSYSFVHQDFGVGFGGIGQDTLDLFNITDIPEVSAWEMTTSIGPITKAKGHLAQWTEVGVSTSGGALAFNDSSDIPCVFAAEVIPEPSSIVALAGGLASLLGRRRRSAMPHHPRVLQVSPAALTI